MICLSTEEGRLAGLFATIATPELYQQNPFRQTGLSVLAGARATAKRVDSLRQTLQLRTAEYRWAFAPGIAPTDEQLVLTGQALKDPQRRFAHEFFWFWPESYPDDAADSALEHLTQREIEPALERWRKAEATGSVVAAHNLAIYHHLQALGGEGVWSVADEVRGITWTETFARWRALQQSPDMWSRMESRVRALDEPQLPLTVVAEMRGSLLLALAMINAELVVRQAQRHDLPRALWHAAFLHEMYAWAASGPRLLEVCARPLAKQLELRLAEADRTARAAPEQTLDQIVQLLEPVPSEIELIERICGKRSGYAVDLRSSFASTILDRLVLHQRETRDNAACLPWIERLKSWSVTPELAGRISEVRAVMSGRIEVPPLPGDATEFVIASGLNVLRISAAGVEFMETFLPMRGITGFRHGYAPVEAETAGPVPCIAWWSARGEIVLGAQNFFGPQGAGEVGYRQIVAACQRWVTPDLVARLATIILEGTPIFVGTASLTPHAVMFSSPDSDPVEPIVVPYPEIQCRLENGVLHFADRRDPRKTASYAAYASWNAVIAGELIEIMTHLQPRSAS